MMDSRRHAVVTGAVFVALALAGGDVRAAEWEKDPAKLCQIAKLEKELGLTAEELKAVEPVLEELAKELERWSWRNDARYEKLAADYTKALRAGDSARASELLNSRRAVESDRQALVDRYTRKVHRALPPARQGVIEGRLLSEEMQARNRRWKLSGEQMDQVRDLCDSQGKTMVTLKARGDLESLARARASIQKYIVAHVFTDAQRASLEKPARAAGPVKSREQLAREQAERIRMAASLWAGKRHMEEVARSQKATQQISNAIVAHNIRMAEQRQNYFNRRRQDNERRRDGDRDNPTDRHRRDVRDRQEERRRRRR